jgi:hypothetical protein
VTLANPVDDVRIRSGQRRLIFATAGRVGLRAEQVFDLVECATAGRTRAIAQLTIGEARWAIGVLKVMERAQTRRVGRPLFFVGAEVDDALLRQAVRRGPQAPIPERCATCNARLPHRAGDRPTAARPA